MKLSELLSLHQRLANKTDFCLLYILYKKGPLYVGDVVNLIKGDMDEEMAQNIVNQIIRRNISAGLIQKQKAERSKNQPGRSSTIISLNAATLPLYIQSLLLAEGEAEIKQWEDKYSWLERNKQLFSQKYPG